MRLHAAGWRSAYHDEVLAAGTAPQDLRSAVSQRLRWAQGTVQVFLRENPLRVPGLSGGQRMMYLSTMLSYFSGFAAVVYMLAPVLYIFAYVLPVRSFSTDFLLHLLPYLVLNWLLLLFIGWGRKTWRGQQYALAFFPVWIRAVLSAAGNVYFHRPLGFVVTPKTRQAGGVPLRLVWPQLLAFTALGIAAVYGITGLAIGGRDDELAVLINSAWIAYNLVLLSVIFPAAFYREEERDDGGSVVPPVPATADGQVIARAGAGRL